MPSSTSTQFSGGFPAVLAEVTVMLVSVDLLDDLVFFLKANSSISGNPQSDFFSRGSKASCLSLFLRVYTRVSDDPEAPLAGSGFESSERRCWILRESGLEEERVE